MLNLITDPWIPVRRDGGRDIIRPDQIAQPDVLFPDWPRADLNLACLELLVGLVYLADPPVSAADWTSREADPERLREAMAPLAPAFDLLGEGPRFLQDFDFKEILGEKEKLPDELFIDSAGDSTAKKNADLMVKRARYPALEPGLAAMALYTLQAFAPTGGQGHRTSMRGGGPMVTLVRPDAPGLWRLIWANVPQGEAVEADELDVVLPWMRRTRTSEEDQPTPPPEDDFTPPETFFGQPKRIRLLDDENGMIRRVIVKNYGTNYEGWRHPLSPYYYDKKTKLPSPKLTKPGAFGYRNWLGIVLEGLEGQEAYRAESLTRFLQQRSGEPCHLLVGGWAMSNMNPQDFLWSEAPVFALDKAGEQLAAGLVAAAEAAAFALAAAVKQACGEAVVKKKEKKKEKKEGECGAGKRARETFFVQTQTPFEAQLDAILKDNGAEVSEKWLAEMRRVALALFNAEVLPGLADLSETRREAAVLARHNLLGTFNGFGADGKKIFQALGMEVPKALGRKKGEA